MLSKNEYISQMEIQIIFCPLFLAPWHTDLWLKPVLVSTENTKHKCVMHSLIQFSINFSDEFVDHISYIQNNIQLIEQFNKPKSWTYTSLKRQPIAGYLHNFLGVH